MSAIREIKGRQIIDSRGNPDGRSGGYAGERRERTCGGAVRGLNR